MGKYDSIINMEHHVSKKHPPMSMTNRGAQFSPFAALTGYGDIITEEARSTDSFSELDETEKERIGRELVAALQNGSRVRITHFVPDEKKNGGVYTVSCGRVTKIDELERKVYLDRRTAVYLDDIADAETAEGDDDDGI